MRLMKGNRVRVAASILMMVGAAFILAGCGKSFSSGDKVLVLMKDPHTHSEDIYATARVISTQGKMVKVDVDNVSSFWNHSSLARKMKRSNDKTTFYVPISIVSHYKKGLKNYKAMKAAFKRAQKADNALFHQDYKKAHKLASQALQIVSSTPDSKEVKTQARIIKKASGSLGKKKDVADQLNALANLMPKFRDMLKDKGLYNNGGIQPGTGPRNSAMEEAVGMSKLARWLTKYDNAIKLGQASHNKALVQAYREFLKAYVQFVNDDKCNASDCQSVVDKELKQAKKGFASDLVKQAKKQTNIKKVKTLKAFDKDNQKIHALVKPDMAELGKDSFDFSSLTRMRKNLKENIAARQARLAYKRKMDTKAYKRAASKTMNTVWGRHRKSFKRRLSDLHYYIKEHPKGQHVKQAKALIAKVKQEENDHAKKVREAIRHQLVVFEKVLENHMRHGTKCENYALSIGDCTLHATHISSDGHFRGYVKYTAYQNGPYLENDVKGQVSKNFKNHSVTVKFKEYKERKRFHFKNNPSLGWKWKVSGKDNQNPNYDESLDGRVSWMKQGQKVGNSAEIDWN